MSESENNEAFPQTEAIQKEYERLVNDREVGKEIDNQAYADFYVDYIKLEEAQRQQFREKNGPSVYTTIVKGMQNDDEIFKYQSKLRIDWKKFEQPVDSNFLPGTRIETDTPIPQQIIDETSATVARVNSIVGLDDPHSPFDSSKPVLKPTIVIREQAKMDQDANATAQGNEIIIGTRFMNDEEQLNKHRSLFQEILGSDSLATNNPDVQLLINFNREKTIAHEVYHHRQKRVLYDRSYLNKNKYKTEKGEYTKKIESNYYYKSNERAADAFAIRYLAEKAKRMDQSSREYQILEKYINNMINTESVRNKDYMETVKADKRISSLKRELEEINQKIQAAAPLEEKEEE